MGFLKTSCTFPWNLIYPGMGIILEEQEQKNDAFVVKTDKAAWWLC